MEGTIQMQRLSLMRKMKEVEEVKGVIQKYRVIGVADLHKVRASQLQELRKKLRKDVYMRVIKNTLMSRALSECGNKPNLERLKEHLRGSNIFLFTNLNPFKLVLLLERSKVKAIARAGDVASRDVIVPAGNTGLPPGPIISQLNAAGLPTRIEAGSVWISRDTLVVRKGEVISERLAAVLSKLGIKSVEVGLSLKAVYDDGVIIAGDDLELDLDEYRKQIAEAYMQAFNLSVNATYPTAENIVYIIQKAYQEARNLAVNAGIASPEVIADLIRKAYAEAVALSARLGLQVAED